MIFLKKFMLNIYFKLKINFYNKLFFIILIIRFLITKNFYHLINEI